MPDIFISPPAEKETASLSPADIKLSEKPSKSSLFDQAISSYMFMPEGIKFETQDQDEAIVLFLRKHWITNFSWVFLVSILLITPIFLFPGVIIGGLIPTFVPVSLISLAVLLWYLFTFSLMLVNFLLWYFTVSIVTTERIIDIDFINILHKKFAATRISKVEDVTMRRGGILKAIFDYGDVVIQTAAHEQEFQFFSVPYPEKVVRIINSLMEKEEKIE